MLTGTQNSVRFGRSKLDVDFDTLIWPTLIISFGPAPIVESAYPWLRSRTAGPMDPRWPIRRDQARAWVWGQAQARV